MGEVDIDALAMEQYLALTRGNQVPGVVKPAIGNNVNFKMKSKFMGELRENTFLGNKNHGAHEHVEKVLDIVSLFNIPGLTHDAVMLHVFPITLTRAAKRCCSDGIEAMTIKLDGLGKDMKKLKENVHVIQVGCGIYEGAHLDKDFPLNEEVKGIEEVKETRNGRRKETKEEESANAIQEVEETSETMVVTTSHDLPIITHYVSPYEPPIPFPGRLAHHAEEALVSRTMESLIKIRVNLIKQIRNTKNYAKHMKNLVVNKPRT
ncbi:hypothetical protein Tco_0749575 [Tanacetum coccineum]|uniref:Uncharacterized protein n=1 Tax=Tanacetum coccineum TaxID=301880 RepID=A0ABQ4YYT4_9ASTR